MPTLPTLTVSQAQMDRLLAVFVDAPGYKEWLRQQIKVAVWNHESIQLQEQNKAAIEAKRVEIENDLNTAT